MGTIAVVAHSGKTLGGGLNELRHELTVAGVAHPLWFEIPKSKMAPKRVREALEDDAEIVFVWGGDAIVQRCVDAMAGSDAALAIIGAFECRVWCARPSGTSTPFPLRGGE